MSHDFFKCHNMQKEGLAELLIEIFLVLLVCFSQQSTGAYVGYKVAKGHDYKMLQCSTIQVQTDCLLRSTTQMLVAT